MTVENTNQRSGPYLTDGVTTTFPFNFKVLSEEHVRVTLANLVTDAETVLVYPTDFDVDIALDDETGGQIITMGAYVAGSSIIVDRNVPRTQDTLLENQGAYMAKEVEKRFDLLTMLAQELYTLVNRGMLLFTAVNRWNAQGYRVGGAAAATQNDDLVTLAQLNAVTAVAGNVPTPGGGNVGKWLRATGAAAFAWTALLASHITDATATGLALMTAANAAAARTALALSAIATYAVASAAEFFAGTASRSIDVALVKTVTAPVTVTITAGAGTIDFNAGSQFVLSPPLAANTTLTLSNAATNMGKTGTIEFAQDGTGGRTIAATGAKTDTGLGLVYGNTLNQKTVWSYYISSTGEVVIGTFARAYA